MQPIFSSPPSPQRQRFGWFYFGYLLLVGGYLIYSTMTQTGLGGWLLAKQMQWFGSASVRLNIMVPLLLAMLLPVPLLPRGERGRVLRGGWLPNAAGQQTPPPQPGLTWRGVFIMAAVPLLLAVPAYFYFQHQAEADEQRPVVPLDLIEQPNPTVPAETKFVHLQGVLQTGYQFVLEQTRYNKVEKTDRYLPLTGPDWRPGQPVRFFLDTNTTAYVDEANNRTLSFDEAAPFPAAFDGELTRGPLPTVVRQDFERAGAPPAEPHYVLQHQYFPGGRPPGAANQQYYLLLVFGVAISLALGLGGGLGKLIRQRRGLA